MPSTHVGLWLLEDQEASSALVEDTMEHLVEDHLRQPVGNRRYGSQHQLIGQHTGRHSTCHRKERNSFALNALPLLPHQLGDMRNLHDRIWFNDSKEVLFEQVVV